MVAVALISLDADGHGTGSVRRTVADPAGPLDAQPTPPVRSGGDIMSAGPVPAVDIRVLTQRFGMPTTLWLDLPVLILAATASIAPASALLGRLAR